MQLKVVSAAKVEQPVQDTAAAIFVITADDIRRSGATSLPEVLRLAPGVEVGRIDSSRWSVAIRGFNGRFANKLLVLVDGRSIYTPLFSGVHWEVQGPPLADIARIEVIRGPGGSLWGANAVNGVINIITKHARDTQGGEVALIAGNQERGITSIRYGGELSAQAQYRVYAQFTERGESVTPAGDDAGDDWRIGKGGFRLDWTSPAADVVTVQGDLYKADLHQNFSLFSLTAPYSQHRQASANADGGSLQARWERQYSATAKISLRASYQFENHKDPLYIADLDTFDLDFQQSFAIDDRQEIVWGMGYRYHQDRFSDTVVSKVRPASRSMELLSVFVQDQIELIPDKLHLTGGVKLEHNDYTGFEWQPSIRGLWTPHPDHRLWAAISRAVRIPSRGEQDAEQVNLLTVPPSPFTSGLPGLLAYYGPGRLDAEELIAYEIGYRTRLSQQLSADVALFYHDYDKVLVGALKTPTVETMPWPPHILLPIELVNGGSGVESGFEIAADWRPTQRWRLRLAYSYRDSDLNDDATGRGIYNDGSHQQISLFSSWSPRDDLDVDLGWRYIASNETNRVSYSGATQLEPYSSLSLRLAWRPRPDLELSLMGTDLMDERHLESVQEAFAFPVEIKRSVYGQIKWSF